jgi:hypothetical protein
MANNEVADGTIAVRPKNFSRKSARMDTKVDTKPLKSGHQDGH